MTSPKHAQDLTGRGRYYRACSAGCPLGDGLYLSVTNAQGVVNKPALAPAAAKVTAETFMARLPSAVKASRSPAGREEFLKAVKAEYRHQWERASDTGTRVHAHAAAHVTGQVLPYDEEVDPYLAEYLAWLEEWRIDVDRHVEAAETTVFDRQHRYAGTGDLWVHLPTGPRGRRQLWVVDIKTSARKPVDTVYIDQVLQLAGLRYAPLAVLADDSEHKVPRFAGAALLNLRTDSHALIPLPADKAAHTGFLHAVGLQRFLHDQDVKTWVPLDVPTLPAPKQKVA